MPRPWPAQRPKSGTNRHELRGSLPAASDRPRGTRRTAFRWKEADPILPPGGLMAKSQAPLRWSRKRFSFANAVGRARTDGTPRCARRDRHPDSRTRCPGIEPQHPVPLSKGRKERPLSGRSSSSRPTGVSAEPKWTNRTWISGNGTYETYGLDEIRSILEVKPDTGRPFGEVRVDQTGSAGRPKAATVPRTRLHSSRAPRIAIEAAIPLSSRPA